MREHKSIRKMQITDSGSWYPKFTTDCDCSLKNLVSGPLRLSTDSGDAYVSLCKERRGRKICLTGNCMASLSGRHCFFRKTNELLLFCCLLAGSAQGRGEAWP